MSWLSDYVGYTKSCTQPILDKYTTQIVNGVTSILIVYCLIGVRYDTDLTQPEILRDVNQMVLYLL